MNESLQTVLVAPMTTGPRTYPTRVACRFKSKAGRIALDQLRTVDSERLVKRLGPMDERTVLSALAVLREMFEE